MTIYADKITMDFETDYYPSHYDRQGVRCKEWKNSVHFQRYSSSNKGRYGMQ